MQQQRISLRLFGIMFLLMGIVISLSAQQKSAVISGRVFTSDGKPASNVSITIEELHRSDMSNSQGF